MSIADLRSNRTADVRTDPLTGHQCLVAPQWDTPKAAWRPAIPLQLPAGSTPCPFCVPADGFDPKIELETGRIGRSNGSWSARSLRNRWPMTQDDGAHEVVVLSDHHDTQLASMPLPQAVALLSFLGERSDVQRERGLHPLLIVNHGALAGSSQPHPHAQIVGLPEFDRDSAAEAPALAAGSCVLCAPPAADLVVADGPALVTVPEGLVEDFEQLVRAGRHGSSLDPFAAAWGIGVALRALYACAGPVAYNLVFHLAHHPHIHVVPRSGHQSGFDASGLSPVMLAPEAAALCLRGEAMGVVARISEEVAA